MPAGGNRFESALLVETDCDTYTNTDIIARWVFTYDGDGSRVKQVYTDDNGTLTTYYFFGGAYEVQDDGATETIRKYYAFAGQTIAMRDGQGLKYFLTDHLGSVAAVTDAAGDVLEQQRYLPFGEIRSDYSSISLTDYGYTFQRALDQQGNQFTLGLMDYKARFYSPYLNRFQQPDSIIPDLTNTQAWNRYSYGYNNPILYADPDGHFPLVILPIAAIVIFMMVNISYDSTHHEVTPEEQLVVDISWIPVTMVAEPIDWLQTTVVCSSGYCDPSVYFWMASPIGTGSMARSYDDIADGVNATRRVADDVTDVAAASRPKRGFNSFDSNLT